MQINNIAKNKCSKKNIIVCFTVITAMVLLLIVTVFVGSSQWNRYIYIFQAYCLNKEDTLVPNKCYTGTWLRWYPNGRLKSEEHYVNGKLHGIYKEWDINGCLVSFGENKDDFEYSGIFAEIIDDGKIDRWHFFDDGSEVSESLYDLYYDCINEKKRFLKNKYCVEVISNAFERSAEISIYDNNVIENIKLIKNAKKLKSLSIVNCSKLKSLSGIEGIILDKLIVSDCIKLDNLNALKYAKISQIEIGECIGIRDYSTIKKSQALLELSLVGQDKVKLQDIMNVNLNYLCLEFLTIEGNLTVKLPPKLTMVVLNYCQGVTIKELFYMISKNDNCSFICKIKTNDSTESINDILCEKKKFAKGYLTVSKCNDFKEYINIQYSPKK